MRRTLVAAFIAAACVTVAVLHSRSAAEPRPPSDVLFNHSLHIKTLGLECAYCHQADSSKAATDQLRPAEPVCLTCHDGERAGGACRLCHRSADAPVGYPPQHPQLHFSHASHLKLAEVDCATCHSAIPGSTKSQAGLPQMSLCLDCHDGIRQTIDCAACHTNPQEVTRIIHPPGWQSDHRIAANIDDPDCDACHRMDDRCSLCHEGDNLTGQIHPFNWESLHGLEARGRVTDCTACHDTQMFCVDCHTARAVQPVNHMMPDWLDRHGDEARFDIESCDACHGTAQPTCNRAGCHDG